MPGSASAVTCDQTLRDSFGGVWDMRTAPASIGEGSIDLGGGNLRSDAFDHFPVLNVSSDGGASWTPFAGTNGECALEVGGRQVSFPSESIAGLSVSREIYVPASGLAFARFLDVLHNPTGAPITVTLDIGGGRADNGELGSDTSTTVNDSSTGDGSTTPGDTSAMTVFDNWATSWDTDTDGSGNPDGDPTLAHDWQTSLPSPVDRADVVGVDSGVPDRFVWQYDSVTVQPGQTVIYMNTEAMRATLPQTHDIAAALGQEPTELFTGMSLAQLDALRNWDGSDVDHDGVKNDADNCLFVQNADQSDIDHDGLGDACDDDMDGDGLSNDVELQIGTDPRNPDTDFDGVRDNLDACPKTPGNGPDGCPLAVNSPSSTANPAGALKVGVTLPAVISRSQFIKGFTVGAACDARCSLEFTLFGDLRIRRAGGPRIAGFNHVFAFTTAPMGTGQRNLKIGACVRKGTVSRKCVRRVKKLLPRRGKHFKLRLAVVGEDASGDRAIARRTLTVR